MLIHSDADWTYIRLDCWTTIARESLPARTSNGLDYARFCINSPHRKCTILDDEYVADRIDC